MNRKRHFRGRKPARIRQLVLHNERLSSKSGLIWYQDRVVNSALDGLRPQMFLEVLPVALYQNGEKMVNRIRAMGLGWDLQFFRYNVASITAGNFSSPFGKVS